MTNIGINGFGRIGKCIFVQLINNPEIKVSAINAPNFDVKYIETYLNYDSVHNYEKLNIEIIDSSNFKVNDNIIHIFNTRNAKEIDWKAYNINYVIDATGSYLTTEKCLQHNAEYVIMCAPPKDHTPLFVPHVNFDKYNGEKIVSNASCTTNCITPVLKFLDEKYGIQNGNFTTIHSTTASQTTVDIVNSNNRTHRSILNNIIPHSTGASSSIFELIPSLTDKIFGTSIRVPTSNVSLVDLNVSLIKKVSFDDLIKDLEKDDFIQVNNKNLVSCDFMTTKCPSIIDKKASMQVGDNIFKLMIWYDNEWSYSSQVIILLEKMIKFNFDKTLLNTVSISDLCNIDAKKSFYIDNYNLSGKKVILRVDWNVPTKNGKITDDYRIVSSLQTIKKILDDGAEKLIIVSHFGRPVGWDLKYSFKKYIEQIQTYFEESIYFLEHGLTEKTIQDVTSTSSRLYLLENIRFHDEETNYKNYDINKLNNIINSISDFYVNDAFGCMHRDHFSICGINTPNKAYGYLVNKEINALEILTKNKDNKKILAIIGGGKMDDKLPLIEKLSTKMNDIYICGGNINSIIKNDMSEYIKKISSNKALIHFMKDGLCAKSLDEIPHYNTTEQIDKNYNFYDIGMDSMFELEKLINKNDIIFWNGTLGVIENNLYHYGSSTLVNILINSGKKVIIGGGDTGGFVNKFKHNFYYITTGGGASIDYISNDTLIGLSIFK
jgi:glyceraldehyde 3-phosphate dehydrogenase